jgi:ParB/RepB/Spo0J family partition protein
VPFAKANQHGVYTRFETVRVRCPKGANAAVHLVEIGTRNWRFGVDVGIPGGGVGCGGHSFYPRKRGERYATRELALVDGLRRCAEYFREREDGASPSVVRSRARGLAAVLAHKNLVQRGNAMGVHARRKNLTRRPGRTITTTPEGIAANDRSAHAFPGEQAGILGRGRQSVAVGRLTKGPKRRGRADDFMAPAESNGHANGVPRPAAEFHDWQQSACGQVVTLYVAECERHPDNRWPTPQQVMKLAASYASIGQLDPIIVRELAPGRYQILSGETRWLAAKQKGWDTIQARVAKDIDDAKALEYLARYNGERSNLDPIQRAMLARRLCQPASAGGGGLKREEAAAAVGLESSSALTNLLTLLELPHDWQERVASGELAPTWAQRLVRVAPAAPVMEALSLDWANRDTFRDTGTFASRDSLERAIDALLDSKVREVPANLAGELSAKEREKLGLFELQLGGEGRGRTRSAQFASNVLLLDELAAKHGRPLRARPKPIANGHASGPATPTPAAKSEPLVDEATALFDAVHELLRWIADLAVPIPTTVLHRVEGSVNAAGYSLPKFATLPRRPQNSASRTAGNRKSKVLRKSVGGVSLKE